MRNGIHSKLTLVDDTQEMGNDAAAHYAYRSQSEDARKAGSQTGGAVAALIAVSVTCIAAAVAAGSYAAWLTRQQATHRVLTDVDDILRSCQSRMSRLEADVQRLPGRQG